MKKAIFVFLFFDSQKKVGVRKNEMNGKKNTKMPESECEIDERNDKSAL